MNSAWAFAPGSAHAPTRTSWGSRSGPETLGGELRALRERLELRPGDLWVHAAAEPAVGRGDDVLAAYRLGEADDPVGDQFGVLDQVGRVADDARQDPFARGQLDVLP